MGTREYLLDKAKKEGLDKTRQGNSDWNGKGKNSRQNRNA